MATRLTKPVSRLVTTPRDGELVITMTQEGVLIRQKGRRKVYGPLGFSHLLTDAALREADIMRQARGNRRPQRRSLRVGL